ncbi:hypothetical protein HanIR_Chr16g0835821 [Helianthus annuus]|nr:hypothetical protein HanIR_Chr16g0835821 [Helianthus annuus]
MNVITDFMIECKKSIVVGFLLMKRYFLYKFCNISSYVTYVGLSLMKFIFDVTILITILLCLSYEMKQSKKKCMLLFLCYINNACLLKIKCIVSLF